MFFLYLILKMQQSHHLTIVEKRVHKMIREKKGYIACPKCDGQLKQKRNGTLKCRLCGTTFTHEEYIQSISQLLLDDIVMFNQVAISQARAASLIER